MRWVSDDMAGACLGGDVYIPDYPADIEVMGYFNDPLLSAEIDGMLDEAELMGIDLDDPELMGAWLKNLMKKIKSRFTKKKKTGTTAAESTLPTVSVSTGKGAVKVGPTGVSYTTAPAATTTPAAAASTMPAAASASAASGFDLQSLLKNKWVIGGGAALLILIIMASKKKKRRPVQ